MGWLAPMVPPVMPVTGLPPGWGSNGFSTTVASTCDTPRTFVVKLYQLSVRSQYFGRVLVASWMLSNTFTVAGCSVVRLAERVPRTFVRNCHEGSVSIA